MFLNIFLILLGIAALKFKITVKNPTKEEGCIWIILFVIKLIMGIGLISYGVANISLMIK